MPTPIIIEQPSSQTILLGDGAAFNVNSIDEGPLSYQWFKDNTEIVGATGNTYIIQTSTLNDNGDYHATVTNGDGTTTSNIATLTVNTPVPPSTLPTITSLSTNIGPANQWIYIFGTNFILNQTNVFFNTLDCGNVFVFSAEQLGIYLSSDATGSGFFKVVTPDGEYTSDIEYTVGSPTSTPTVTDLRDHPDPNSKWVYVDGTEFVSGQTTITYDSGSKTVDVFVYTVNNGGFAKVDLADVITTITLTTPNGSAEFTANPVIL
jgi:hypothetical protein